ncbi:MAG TPA: outer membrane beta-barrel protein [Allosphingosinicella sp.]|nr:outer membrane beta-barrel protein [Allosphingosinicella sp.]
MRKYLVAVLFAAAAAAPAAAQTTGTGMGGLRLEGLVGYETTDIEDEGADGVTYGVGLGYDVQSGNAVFGVEAEAMESNISQCVAGFPGAGDTLCAKGGRDLYVGARAGAVIGANSLVYAKAGYTNTRFELEFDPAVGANTTARDNLDGVRVGAGLQFGFSQNLYAKAEYRYSNYEQGYDKHQGLVGLGFKF